MFFSFELFSGLFSFVFILIIGVVLVSIVCGLRQWNNNNRAPRLTVDAVVVSKRANVSHRRNQMNEEPMISSSTTYYATFQVSSGDRIELRMAGVDYGMLAEGDHGKLTFQGTRYLGFARE